MPSLRHTAVVLLAVLLAGCASEPDSPGPATDDRPATAGPFGHVDDERPTDEDGSVEEMALGPDGEPVLLVARDITGDATLEVTRPTRTDEDGWTSVTLEITWGHPVDPALAVAADGTVIVAGTAGHGYVVSRITPEGELDTVPVDAPGHDLLGVTSAAVAPDGGTVYLGLHQPAAGSAALLAVDAATGEVTAEHALPAEPEGWIRLDRLQVTGDGEQVLAAVTSRRAGEAPTASLARLHADLQPRDEVPLVAARAPSQVFELAADAAGGAHLAVLHGDERTPGATFHLVSVAAEATEATEVAELDVQTAPYGFAVDPAGQWAYVAGVPRDADSPDLLVTPVEVDTGRVGQGVTLCSTPTADLAVTPDGSRAVARTSCDGDATIWTLT